MFYISKCSLRTANKKFSTIKNDYEIFLNNDSLIEPVSKDIIATTDFLYSIWFIVRYIVVHFYPIFKFYLPFFKTFSAMILAIFQPYSTILLTLVTWVITMQMHLLVSHIFLLDFYFQGLCFLFLFNPLTPEIIIKCRWTTLKVAMKWNFRPRFYSWKM